MLGSDLVSVAKLAGAAPTSAKVIHVRPALVQELEWRPRYYSGGASPLTTDPVDVMHFKFYDNQLFMVVADYDRRRTEGMAAADMIAAISETYGAVSQVPSRRLGTPTVQYGFPDTPLAVWGTAEYSVTLLRVAYPESFRLVVALTRLENLARYRDRSGLAARYGRSAAARNRASEEAGCRLCGGTGKGEDREQGAVQAIVCAALFSTPGCRDAAEHAVGLMRQQKTRTNGAESRTLLVPHKKRGRFFNAGAPRRRETVHSD